MGGTLYVVGTPIGNLNDITPRALETLKNVDIIACENTSRHLKLLNFFNIKKRLIECSPANEKNSAKGIVGLLAEGKNIALVSDAGAPGLSDPGRFVVDEARNAGHTVIPIPGVSALTTLVSVSGFPGGQVVFLGFLSKTPGKQERELAEFRGTNSIVVFFVNQYGIKKILPIVNKALGNVEIIIGREMTKVNEEYIRGKVLDIMERNITEKGEFTVALFAAKEKKN